MSAKNMDKKNRWRSKTVGFRMSPEEATQLDTLARLSGLTKQDYITCRVLNREVTINPNPRVYKTLKNELQAVHEQLIRLSEINADHEELLDLTQYVASILVGVKGEVNEFRQEKATDLATSASTDMNQSLNLDINTIPNSQQIINKNVLETMSLGEIYDTVFQPKTQIIEGMLQTGAYLFVGAPKIGKSFLMVQIGYCVSKGLPLWGFKIYQGTVLYLALEDDYSRIQQRLCTMFGEEDNDNLYFATRSRNLSEGLQQLENFLSEHTDTKLIIIDTLHKIREKGSDKYSYANDNDIASAIK
ncbi:MAG: AAA family ATPase [Parabacteroides sp.]|nr:AAA family ATPase [Parabacteroides sp.]